MSNTMTKGCVCQAHALTSWVEWLAPPILTEPLNKGVSPDIPKILATPPGTVIILGCLQDPSS